MGERGAWRAHYATVAKTATDFFPLTETELFLHCKTSSGKNKDEFNLEADGLRNTLQKIIKY